MVTDNSVELNGMEWDRRHELIERTLLEHLARALDGTAEYDDATQSWLICLVGGALPLDVTAMAADVNVGLGPPPTIATSGGGTSPEPVMSDD